MQQPTQPDALAQSSLADAVHAVVPVATAHQRQAVPADLEAVVQRPGTVFVEGRRLSRELRLEEVFSFVRLQHGAAEERNDFGQYGRVGRRLHIVGRRVGEPDPVVRDASPHALAGVREPPMLDIAFGELPGRGPQQMGSQNSRFD